VATLDGPLLSSDSNAHPARLHEIAGVADGLHLVDSILSFDSFDGGLLSFVSSTLVGYKKQYIKPQIIASEETFRLLNLQGKSQSPLICQYNRPFSVGHLKMELLPAGNVVGGASLHVENQHGRLLYAPALQPFHTGIVRRMQIKKAETLILRAVMPPEKKLVGATRGRERERLLTLVSEHLSVGRTPIIIAESYAIAPEIIKFLTDHGIPLAVHASIATTLRQYRDLQLPDGLVTRFNRRHRMGKTLILPDYAANRFLLTENIHRKHPCIWVHAYSGEYPWEYAKAVKSDLEQTADSVYLSLGSDLGNMKEVIKAVQPRQVFFFGPYAKKYAEECSDMVAAVRPIYYDFQPALF
jgi:hypothetical protein